MSFKSFKNARAARRHMSHILFNLQAVDKHLKPCYLWDSFVADIDEIQNYLDKIYCLAMTDSNLRAFSINDTIFVTDFKNLKNYFDTFNAKQVGVVDVSKSNTNPSIPSTKEKIKLLNPILDSSYCLLKDLENFPCSSNIVAIDSAICNMTTLFGALLGYPALYWYVMQSPEMDLTCLSMVPLKLYKVYLNNKKDKNFDLCHDKPNELYSFSIPEKVAAKTERFVEQWFESLVKKCEGSRFSKLDITHETVILPQVSM